MSEVKKYVGKDIVVTYERRRCLHVAECLRRLPDVFDTYNRPWVQAENGTADDIADTVTHCPTGALHFERTDGGAQEEPRATNVVVIARNGPYYVFGDLEIVMPDGSVLNETRAALCRCGASNNKPFCDNTHRTTGFRDDGLPAPEANVSETQLPTHQKLRITPRPNRSLKFEGAFEIYNARGELMARSTERTLCRCGASNEKPFCDGTHKSIGFQTEPASTQE
jgi:CDGSH-type Zn-finger protein/uncharacterized Fe-S cluster protein YjdI